MKVKELIELLSKLDQEKEILLNSEDWINDIGDIEAIKNRDKDVYVIFEALTYLIK